MKARRAIYRAVRNGEGTYSVLMQGVCKDGARKTKNDEDVEEDGEPSNRNRVSVDSKTSLRVVPVCLANADTDKGEKPA
jgi:hypothetical protein